MTDLKQSRFAASQVWTYRAPPGFEQSRLVIGAIADFSDAGALDAVTAGLGTNRIVCISVLDCPRREPDGTLVRSNIPFLPMTEAAFAASVVAPDGVGEPLEGFAQALRVWSEDERGLSMFTVPFDGRLDLLIARQMRDLVGDAA